MNYKEIVASLRDTARNQLRMELINDRLGRVLELNSTLNSTKKRYEEQIALANKGIAVANYKLSKLEDADPEAEQKRLDYTKTIEQQTKFIETETKHLETDEKYYNGLLKEQEEGIAKIESGETKVSKELMLAKTQELINAITDEAVRSKLADVVAAEIEPVA